MTHSGLQLGGLPMYVGLQLQDGDPPMSLHSLFGPQGDGTQGFTYAGGVGGSGGGARKLQILDLNLQQNKCRRTWNWITASERISSVSRSTTTNRTVVDHLTVGVKTASSWTRIDALLIHASLLKRTFEADHAFGTTTWWTAYIIG